MSQELYKRTGILLKQVRLNTFKMSQAEFAKKFKIHVQYVSNIERGVCIPQKKMIKSLVKKGQLDPIQYSTDAGLDHADKVLNEIS